MELVGHRGLSNKYTENTIEAFLDAFNNGADAVEMDVQLTKDNVPIIFHDFDLNRLFGINKKVNELRLEEIRKLRLKNGEFIPTLFEVLEKLKGKKLFIELKTLHDDFTRTNENMPKIVYDILKNFDNKNIVIISFDIKALSDLREIDDKISLGLDFEENSENLISNEFLYEVLEDNNIEYFLPEFSISKNYVELKRRYKIIPWVINKKDDLDKVKSFSYGVISDRVDIIKNYLK